MQVAVLQFSVLRLTVVTQCAPTTFITSLSCAFGCSEALHFYESMRRATAAFTHCLFITARDQLPPPCDGAMPQGTGTRQDGRRT